MRKLTAGAFGIVVVVAAAGCGAPGVSDGPGGASDSSRVLVCESGAQTHGDVETSSAVAVRVPEGTPVPPGCRLA